MGGNEMKDETHFIGDVVKLKSNVTKQNISEQQFINTAIKEKWLWLITGMDNEDLDYIIQPMYLDLDSNHLIELGSTLLVLNDEIETVKINREDLFIYLNNLNNN